MKIKLGVMLSSILILIFATLWIRSNVINLEYRLSNLEKQKKTLIREREVLMAEKISLTSFVKLEKSLELTFPDRCRVIYITSSEFSALRASFNQKN